MSTIDSEDRNVTGYFLPEDALLRLKQLRDYVGFLASLARPCSTDEEQTWTAEIRASEMATCLAMLEEQIGQVLGRHCPPAERHQRAAAGEADPSAGAQAAAPEATEPAMEDAGNGWSFGVGLAQIDEIHLLLDSLRAHGNVVASSDEAKLKDVTLSIMGDAICRDAQKLRDIVDAIYDAQRLQPPHNSKPGVREEGATYLTPPACMSMDGAPHIVRQLPTYH